MTTPADADASFATIPGNEHALAELRKLLQTGRAIAFVGAGASAGMYPLWNQLIAQLAGEAVRRGFASDVDRRLWLERLNPQQAVQGVKKALGEGTYCEQLQEIFGPRQDSAGKPCTATHDLLLQLPFRGYVTTNYDPGLIEARRLHRPEIASAGIGTWKDRDIVARWLRGDIFDQPAPILFAHGIYDRCETIVLGAGEYRQAYREGVYRKLFDKLWGQERLVFVGFGFSDSWLEVFADEVLTQTEARDTAAPRHIAVIGLDADEPYTPELRRFAQDQYHAQVVFYRIRRTDDGGQDHGQLQQLLAAVAADTPAPPPPPERPGGDGKAPAKPAVPAAYLEWLRRQSARLDLLGLRLKEGRVLRLNNVYVPLTTPASEPPDEKAAARAQRGREQEQPKPSLLLASLAAQSLYVSGPPGSGKSTFCRWVTLLCCEGDLPPRDVPDPDDYREQFPPAFRGRLPLLVRLREFWESLPHDNNRQQLSCPQLEAALGRWLAATKPNGLTADLIEKHLAAGSALLIFDGVDEVPIAAGEGPTAWHPRRLLLSGLSEAAAAWDGRGNRLLVTSRPYGLCDAEQQQLGLKHAPLEDLAPPLQDLLVGRWFHVLSDSRQDAEKYTGDMIGHIRERAELNELVANPMLLTAMCILYNEGKRLPEDKHELYARMVDNVLYNRFHDSATIDKIRNRLCVVAYGMHTGTGLGEQRRSPQAQVTFDEIHRMLETYRQKSRYTDEGFRDLVAVREELLSQTGLLLPRPDQQAAFYHLSIQEFLAAQRTWDLESDRLPAVYHQRGTVPEWQNTLTFLFGAQRAKSADPDRSIRLLEQLIEQLQPEELGLQVVVAECLQMLLAKNIRLTGGPEQEFRQLCLSAIERPAPLRERNLLGLALGHLGDTRVVTDLRSKEAYIEIPVGRYPVGDEDKSGYSIFEPLSSEVFELSSAIFLSRYPVTNSQFTLFIDDKGYANEDLWSEGGREWLRKDKRREPRLWRSAKYNGPNQPVVGVTYWEAEAFCKWAGGRLPREREWEAAARGPQGHVYPWGDEWEDGICNSSETGLSVTTPVGLFPKSRSQDFRLEDMAGNVWEWCAEEHERYGRVLRGGSFVSYRTIVRCAARSYLHPSNHWSLSGFRVART